MQSYCEQSETPPPKRTAAFCNHGRRTSAAVDAFGRGDERVEDASFFHVAGEDDARFVLRDVEMRRILDAGIVEGLYDALREAALIVLTVESDTFGWDYRGCIGGTSGCRSLLAKRRMKGRMVSGSFIPGWDFWMKRSP